jgi:hypothetical protein
MPLNVTLDFPADLEEKLRRETPNLDADVKEAYALELFRRGRLSHYWDLDGVPQSVSR